MLSARLVKGIDAHAVAAAMMLAKPLCSQQDAVTPD